MIPIAVADTAELLDTWIYNASKDGQSYSQEGMELLLLVENPANRDGSCSVAKFWDGKLELFSCVKTPMGQCFETDL